jgi:hypothetical protein
MCRVAWQGRRHAQRAPPGRTATPRVRVAPCYGFISNKVIYIYIYARQPRRTKRAFFPPLAI